MQRTNPYDLDALTHLAVAFRMDGAWATVVRFLSADPRSAVHIVAAAPWDDVHSDGQTLMLSAVDDAPIGICAAIAFARGMRDQPLRITRELACAFFAAAPGRADDLDQAVREFNADGPLPLLALRMLIAADHDRRTRVVLLLALQPLLREDLRTALESLPVIEADGRTDAAIPLQRARKRLSAAAAVRAERRSRPASTGGGDAGVAPQTGVAAVHAGRAANAPSERSSSRVRPRRRVSHASSIPRPCRDPVGAARRIRPVRRRARTV